MVNLIDIHKLEKLYYSIGEVAGMLGVSKSLIRYWETEFDFLTPRKNKKGDRRFTKENIEQLLIIHHLLKERGFTIEGAKHEIKAQKKNLLTRQEILRRLAKVRDGLDDLRDSLEPKKD
jgi:DNA-binding transcriptional MerR regulator